MSQKIRLGLSLYPEQESLEDIESYLKMASERGFTKAFTSLFSVQGTKEEIINYFKNFTTIAHRYGFEVDGDVNMASERGFTKAFTSLFSVQGTKEEIINYFKNFTTIAHRYGFEVDGDVNSAFFEMMGAKADDLSLITLKTSQQLRIAMALK